jgi:hypothetical protein
MDHPMLYGIQLLFLYVLTNYLGVKARNGIVYFVGSMRVTINTWWHVHVLFNGPKQLGYLQCTIFGVNVFLPLGKFSWHQSSLNLETMRLIWVWYIDISIWICMCLSIRTRSPLLNNKVLLPYFIFYPNILAKAKKLTKQRGVALSIIIMHVYVLFAMRRSSSVEMTNWFFSKYVA